MLIQSKKVWIADQFIAAAIEMKDGKIIGRMVVDFTNGAN